MITGNIWIANKYDSLETLAFQEYNASPEDWQCIWPVSNSTAKNYPNVKNCDVYDASNLSTKSTFQYHVNVGGNTRSHQLAFGLNNVFNNFPIQNLPLNIKLGTQLGANPIYFMTIHGHTNPSSTSIYQMDSSGDHIIGSFNPDQLIALSKPPSYELAKKRQGPHRCWFSRNATIWIAGCKSNNAADYFAKKLLRKGAIAMGTNHYLVISDSPYSDSPFRAYKNLAENIITKRPEAIDLEYSSPQNQAQLNNTWTPFLGFL